ncbi:hypothetical protein, partial [Candidatus Ichthyocystis sparus]|uniref:hypothetical protein n=1 Tax=Candidatus Ichthyocystis sparus TaxID=1561004 RepID=UPI001F5FA434
DINSYIIYPSQSLTTVAPEVSNLTTTISEAINSTSATTVISNLTTTISEAINSTSATTVISNLTTTISEAINSTAATKVISDLTTTISKIINSTTATTEIINLTNTKATALVPTQEITKSNSIAKFTVIIVAVFLALAIAILTFICCKYRSNKKSYQPKPVSQSDNISVAEEDLV